MAKETAEEKLLKALQKKSASPVSSTKKSSDKTGFKFSLSIFQLNRFLFLGIIVCIVVLVLQLRSGIALLHKELDVTDEVKASSRLEKVSLPTPKNVKYYIDSFGNRNIFKPYDISLGKATEGQPNL